MSTQADKQDKVQMHPFWGPVWGLWFFTWVFLEMFILIEAIPDIAILAHFILFLPNELQGAMRKRWSNDPKGQRKQLGDTLSEFVWTFTQGGTSRDWAGRFLALALGVRLISFPWLFDGVAGWPIWIDSGWETPGLIHTPFVLIGLGIMFWLLEHFPREGRTG